MADGITLAAGWTMQLRYGTATGQDAPAVRRTFLASGQYGAGNGWRFWDPKSEPPVWAALHASDMAAFTAAFHRHCNTWSYSWRIVTAAGEVVWMHQAEG